MTRPDEIFPIAAIILTHNEEKNIEACLKSVAGWCQEIFIVDSGSTDNTGDICRKYTERIYKHPFQDHPSQWNWALSTLPLTCDWVMPLDADHIISEELHQELWQVMRNPDPMVDGYYARHRYFFWDVPIRGFKSRSLCLFRRGRTRLDFGELVDHRFVVDGQTRNLAGIVYEINRNEWDIDNWIDKHQKYSSRLAIQEVLSKAGDINRDISPSLLGNPDERIIWAKNLWQNLPLYFRPCLYFFYRYFIRLGFLDGKVGFIYHFLHAFWFRLMVDIKIAELSRQISRGEITLSQLKEAFLQKRALSIGA